MAIFKRLQAFPFVSYLDLLNLLIKPKGLSFISLSEHAWSGGGEGLVGNKELGSWKF